MANMVKIEDRPTWNSMSTPKITERMVALHESGKWQDCVFKLFKSDESGEELVFAHRLILASSSLVFEALFYGPMAEEGPISVTDVDPLAFRLMLKFIYTDTVDFTSVETACNVLYASKKYLIYTLAGLAIVYISHHIDESNCLKIYIFSKFVQEELLVRESWNYLCSHLDGVLKHCSDEFLTNDVIESLVNEEALNGGELVLFQICHMWAEAECRRRNLEITGENMRKLLIEMNVLNKIRWFTLTQEEFEEGPIKSGILNNLEINFIKETIYELNSNKSNNQESSNLLDLKKHQSSVPYSPTNDIQERLNQNSFPLSVSTIVKARKNIPLKHVYCHRFIEREFRLKKQLQHDLKMCTLVTANKSIRLTGIYFNAKKLPVTQLYAMHSQTRVSERHYKERLNVTVCDNDNKTLFSVYFCETVKYDTIFKIPLKTPVIFEQLKEYKINVDLMNSAENYLFGVRNSVSKFPSGLCVTFKECTSTRGYGIFLEPQYLSLVSGLELSV